MNMKVFSISALVLASSLALTGCGGVGDDPETITESYLELMESVVDGNEVPATEDLVAGYGEKGASRISRELHKVEDMMTHMKRNDVELNDFSVEVVDIDIDGDKAKVTIEKIIKMTRKGEDKVEGDKDKVRFKKVDGDWLLTNV